MGAWRVRQITEKTENQWEVLKPDSTVESSWETQEEAKKRADEMREKPKEKKAAWIPPSGQIMAEKIRQRRKV